MFDLVCDIEEYPKFVPLCRALQITDRREKGSKVLVRADMTMAYGMLSETFTTQVLMNTEARTIDTRYIDGPFHHLDNQWLFRETPDEGCTIEFMVDYELKNSLLSLASSGVFETAFNRFVDAFEKRANAIYGS